MVGAGTVAAANDRIADCFLPGGAENWEGKTGGEGGGGSRV